MCNLQYYYQGSERDMMLKSSSNEMSHFEAHWQLFGVRQEPLLLNTLVSVLSGFHSRSLQGCSRKRAAQQFHMQPLLRCPVW